MHRSHQGFTLIELMIVVAIISTLSTFAIPIYSDYLIRSQMSEAFAIAEDLKPSLKQYHQKRGRFPSNNKQAGLPKAELLMGNYVSAIVIDNGAMHVYLGNKVHQAAQGKIVSIRPLVVQGSPKSPASWLCGEGSVPDGMQALGANLTDVPREFLPIECRI